MKVLFFVFSGGIGGAERVVSRICNRLIEQKIEVEVYGFSNHNDYFDTIGVHYSPLKINRKNALFKFFSSIKSIRKILKNTSALNIFSFLDFQNILVLLSSFGLKKKIYVSERNDPKSRNIFIRFLCNFFYRFSKKVIFQTEYAKKCYSKYIQRRCCVIGNPISNNLFSKRYNGSSSNRLINISRLEKQKNLPLLINSMVHIHNILPNVTLSIFGDGSLREELSNLIDFNHASNYIRLEGFSNNVVDELCISRALVISSDYEGISNVMLESLAVGTPVITTKTQGGVTEIIKDGWNGIIVECDNVQQMCDAVVKIFNDESLSKHLSSNGKQIKSSFGEDVIIKKWIDLVFAEN